MTYSDTFLAGLPHLDPYTISEDRVVELACFTLWENLATSLGLRPSQWIDSKGDRMYAAIMYLKTQFDLSEPTFEDAEIEVRADIVAIRKPHALGVVTFTVKGREIARCTIMSSFIKREIKGSNKKFSKVRDIWQAEDFNGDQIDALLDRHHAMKSTEQRGEVVNSVSANRATDFNPADFMYFKNYARYAKAAEWNAGRDGPTRMTRQREAFYYGNVDDGMRFDVVVAPDGDTDDGQTRYLTSILANDRRIFLCLTEAQEVTFPLR